MHAANIERDSTARQPDDVKWLGAEQSAGVTGTELEVIVESPTLHPADIG
jgi:hypothetical protein